MINKNKKEKGFTLVELLLVIAIIGILASILMVGMGAWRKKTKAVSVMETNRSALGYAIECYLRDKELTDPSDSGNICSGSSITWPALKYGYIYDGTDITSWTWTAEKSGSIIWCSAIEGKCCIIKEGTSAPYSKEDCAD